jgi:hypothetical protein
MSAVDRGGFIASLVAREKPVCKDLVHGYCHCSRTWRMFGGIGVTGGEMTIFERSL